MSKLLEGLNNEQLQAVTHTNGPLLIVAGAGTGKTTVITRRIAYLLELKLAQPEEILALTFTDKAATEMEDRVDKYTELGSTYGMQISTFHSFCEEILKDYGLDIKLPNDFKLLSETSQWVFVHKNLNKFALDYYRPIGSPNKFIASLLSHFSKCKDELISPAEYLEYATNFVAEEGDDEALVEKNRLLEVAGAYQTYQQLLLDNECLDFGDVIFYCVELFKTRPNILKKYQERFKYIAVDEFQDTNRAQYELIKLLAGEKQNLVVVGDDDQSIYKFRGASVSNILKLGADYPKMKSVTLINNYRSTQEILDSAYRFIQHNNPNRLEKIKKIKKRLIGHNEEAGEIQVIEGKNLSEELNLVVEKCLELKKQFPKITWDKFAILSRTNSNAKDITPILEARGIPYNFVANKGLYKKPLIAGLISYLKLLRNYHDSIELFQVMNFPIFQLDAIDISHLTQFTNRKTISVYEAMHNDEVLALLSEKSRTTINVLLAYLDEHTKLCTEKSAIELFVTIISDLKIQDYLNSDTLESSQNREYVEQFRRKIENYCQTEEDRTMRGYLGFLDLELKAGEEGSLQFDPNSDPETLKVMTVHGSKGLEFKFVFIINMIDQKFPSRKQSEGIEIPEALVKEIIPEDEENPIDHHREEERRLFYVAMTRAETHLYFSWSVDYGGKKDRKPSIFLTEAKLIPAVNPMRATGKVVFAPITKTGELKKVYKKLPVRFSYSQIKSFNQCPLEYKYQSYLNIPYKGNHFMSFGSTIHSVLEKYMKAYKKSAGAKKAKLPEEKMLFDLYDKEWLGDWYETPEQQVEFKKRGLQILKSFYESTLETIAASAPTMIEESFSLKLGAENQYSFNGKIDRADETPNGLKIIDYKTSEKVPKKTDASDLDQLRIYQWACEEFFHIPVAELQYWYVYPNETKTVTLASHEELDVLKEKVLETIEQIREAVQFDRFSELHKKSKQHICNYAD